MQLDDIITCVLGALFLGAFYWMTSRDRKGMPALKDSLDIIVYTKDAQDQALTVLCASELELIKLLRSAADSLREAKHPEVADLLTSGFSDWIEKRNRSVNNLNQTFLQNHYLTLSLLAKVKVEAPEGMKCSAAALLSKSL